MHEESSTPDGDSEQVVEIEATDGRHFGRLCLQLELEHLDACRAADHLAGQQRKQFHALLGPIHRRFEVGGIGFATIQVDERCGIYEPSEGGAPAFVFACRPVPLSVTGPIYDLVAWEPGTTRIWRRTGLMDVMGEWNLSAPYSAKVTVFANPGTWARSNGDGVVVLDWRPAVVQPLLGHCGMLIGQNLEVAESLLSALHTPTTIFPKVTVAAVG